MIIRGTTPHYTFVLPVFEAEIWHGYITFSQSQVTKFSKTFVEEDLKLVDDHLELEVALTQEDTLSFKYFGIPMKDAISIQIKLISSSGDVCASEVMLETVGQALYGRML